MEFRVIITEEAADFIRSTSDKMKMKIQRTISLLKSLGYMLSEPHSKKLKSTDYLYELRVKAGADICCLFYFHWKDKIYVVTSGYIKKTNKTDPDEIKKAVRIMNSIKGVKS
jgi:phage-related protein